MTNKKDKIVFYSIFTAFAVFVIYSIYCLHS